VGHGNAVGALNWGLGSGGGAADGEPESRRRSGECWRSEQGKWNGKEVCKCQDVY
jgi:hypothetical protein